MDIPNISFFTCILATSALGYFLPTRTRPDIFFGVTIDPAFRNSDEARRMLTFYRIALWSSALLASALDFMVHRPGLSLLFYVIGVCCTQIASHRSVLPHAASRSTTLDVDLSAPQEHIPGGLLTALLPLIALLGLGGWGTSHVDQLPNRLPVYWDFSGPTRWVITSSPAITLLLVQYALVCLLLMGSALGVLHWSRRISGSGLPAASERQFRRRTVLLILTSEYFLILPPLFDLLQAPALAMKVWTVAFGVTIVSFVISLMRAGQGGARLVVTNRSSIGDRTEDARWIGGLLYFNPNDPALLVEKRMGIGWTVNFGNPRSWLLVIAVAVIVAVGPLTLRAGSNLAVGGALQSPHPGDRLQTKSASPGTEESLHRYIMSLKQGQPNYDEMSPQLAKAVSQQLPKITAVLNELGEFVSLTYEGTDQVGADIYIATFARGRLEWHIGPLVDGKVALRYFRRLS